MITFFATIVRILSNSLSNVYQKQLVNNGYNPAYINFVMYAGLTICAIPIINSINLFEYHCSFWLFAVIGGFLGALGNSYLVKALKNGELSILGPINAYKSVVAMFFGILLLKEIPSLYGIVAIVLIIFGSYFLFETQEEGFSLQLIKRQDIRYRIYALIFTALEAICIKNVINESGIIPSFIAWCFFGMIFTAILSLHKKHTPKIQNFSSIKKFAYIIILMGIMQISTNYVFSHMQVSYGLALFQLSTIVSVILGWKYFDEKHIPKKLFGTAIMILGAAIIILTK